jgi:hypothetical protein
MRVVLEEGWAAEELEEFDMTLDLFMLKYHMEKRCQATYLHCTVSCYRLQGEYVLLRR